MHIRPATLPDAGAIAAIYAHWVEHSVVTFDLEAPSEDAWARRLADAAEGGFPALVGEVDGQVVGYATVTAWKAKAAYGWTVEDSVYLAPTATGAGYGRALLERLVADTREAGFRQIVTAISTTATTASVDLHTALGFVPVGRLHRVGWKHDRWVDVDLLQLDLG